MIFLRIQFSAMTLFWISPCLCLQLENIVDSKVIRLFFLSQRFSIKYLGYNECFLSVYEMLYSLKKCKGMRFNGKFIQVSRVQAFHLKFLTNFENDSWVSTDAWRRSFKAIIQNGIKLLDILHGKVSYPIYLNPISVLCSLMRTSQSYVRNIHYNKWSCNNHLKWVDCWISHTFVIAWGF